MNNQNKIKIIIASVCFSHFVFLLLNVFLIIGVEGDYQPNNEIQPIVNVQNNPVQIKEKEESPKIKIKKKSFKNNKKNNDHFFHPVGKVIAFPFLFFFFLFKVLFFFLCLLLIALIIEHFDVVTRVLKKIISMDMPVSTIIEDIVSLNKTVIKIIKKKLFLKIYDIYVDVRSKLGDFSIGTLLLNGKTVIESVGKAFNIYNDLHPGVIDPICAECDNFLKKYGFIKTHFTKNFGKLIIQWFSQKKRFWKTYNPMAFSKEKTQKNVI